MTEARTAYLATLRAGLRGVPSPAVDEAIREYAAHFDDGAAANRSDEEIAAALGEPLALADELRVELQIEAWEENRSPRSAAATIVGILGLGVVNFALIFLLGPVLLLLALGLIVAIAALLSAGVWLLFAGASLGLPGGMAAILLASAGTIAAAISLFAFGMLGAIGIVNGLVRYARLRYKLRPRTHQPETES